MGEKDVALPYDQLTFSKDANNNLIVGTSATKESLETAPEYQQARRPALRARVASGDATHVGRAAFRAVSAFRNLCTGVCISRFWEDHMHEPQEVLTPTEARQASPRRLNFRVLTWSLALAVIAAAVLYTAVLRWRDAGEHARSGSHAADRAWAVTTGASAQSTKKGRPIGRP